MGGVRYRVSDRSGLSPMSEQHPDHVLEDEGSDLVAPMSVREGGEVTTVPSNPTNRIVVFVFTHGQMRPRRLARLGGRESYGTRLAREFDVTPVDIRFNTGSRRSRGGCNGPATALTARVFRATFARGGGHVNQRSGQGPDTSSSDLAVGGS